VTDEYERLAEHIASLGRQVTDLGAQLEQYRRQACTIRSFEDIWADTYPGYLATGRQAANPHLRVVR